TSRTLHFFFALLLCNISQLLYIAIPPCTYFLKLLRPLHCCTVCLFVLCCIFCVSTLRVTLPSQIPCLCKLTWPIKPDSDSDSDSVLMTNFMRGVVCIDGITNFMRGVVCIDGKLHAWRSLY